MNVLLWLACPITMSLIWVATGIVEAVRFWVDVIRVISRNSSQKGR